MAATPKWAAQAIRKVYDLGWRPTFLMAYPGANPETVLNPAGLEKSIGLLSAYYGKNDTVTWKDDPGFQAYVAFMKKYYPEGNLLDASNHYGYLVSQTLHQVLKQAGNDLTRANIMKQAANLKGYRPEGLLPGIRINTDANDFAPIESEQLIRFDGKQWQRFGAIIGK